MALIVVLRNLSSLAPVSDYAYEVLVGDGGPTSRTITEGVVKGHRRDDGWRALVQRLLDEEVRSGPSHTLT